MLRLDHSENLGAEDVEVCVNASLLVEGGNDRGAPLGIDVGGIKRIRGVQCRGMN